MLVEKIDDIGPETFEGGFGHLPDVLRPAVQDRPAPLHRPGIDAGIEPELGGDDHPVAQRCERLTDQFLVGERAVNLCRIEKCYAPFHGCSHEGDHLLPVFRGSIRKTHSHAAEPECRNFQTACSQCTLLHRLLLPMFATTLLMIVSYSRIIKRR